MNRRAFTKLSMCWFPAGLSAQLRPKAEKSQSTEAARRRMALLIGNAAYLEEKPLQNAIHDAMDLAEALRALGFNVKCIQNADRKILQAAVDEFAASLRSGDIAVFYFAGHGFQLDAENFLLPIDYRRTQNEAIARESSYPGSGRA